MERRTQAMRDAHYNLAKNMYEQQIRANVETEENIGKLLTIDTNTGDYEIDTDHMTAVRRLRARRPEADISTLRIGYNAVYAIGGTLKRTAP